MNQVVVNYEEEYSHLRGKRLLILGGVRPACDIVKRAKKMGVHVIVADYLLDSPAKRIADEAVNLNAVDVGQIVDYCRNNPVDGITTGYVDILLKPCREACDILGLPYYAPNLLIEMSTNKETYKRECRKYGIPVPRDYVVDNSISLENMAKSITFPVFIKPVDNSGSRGAFVCHTEEDFLVNYPIALSFSPSGNVMVEEYLTGQDVILDYLLKDGEAYFLSMFDRNMCSDRTIAVNHANLLLSPSDSVDLFIRDVDPLIKKMVRELHFQDGILFFQGYSNNGKITLFEMGCRMGGTFSDIAEAFFNINPIDALIHFALTGKMADYADYSHITPKVDGCGAVLNILLKDEPKKICKLTGLDIVNSLPQVVNCVQFFQEGDTIPNNYVTDRPLLIIYLACNNRNELKLVLDQIYNGVDAIDENGMSMLKQKYYLQQSGG